MNTLEIIFFILLSIVFYTYIGYGIILWILVRIKRIFIKEKSYHTNDISNIFFVYLLRLIKTLRLNIKLSTVRLI